MSYSEKDEFPMNFHDDFHHEITYDVHNSLYNVVGYFS
jgi:hypothetical protein